MCIYMHVYIYIPHIYMCGTYIRVYVYLCVYIIQTYIYIIYTFSLSLCVKITMDSRTTTHIFESFL